MHAWKEEGKIREYSFVVDHEALGSLKAACKHGKGHILSLGARWVGLVTIVQRGLNF